MEMKQRKPGWWILYALLISVIGALALESWDGLPSWANEFAGIGIVLGFFSVVAVWVSVNTPFLEEEDYRKHDNEELRVYEYPLQPTEEKTASTGGNFDTELAKGHMNATRN